MEQKEPTKGQLQNRLRNAILHIDKTKDTQSIYFDDKGLRLTINEDVAIIATGFHQHVFQNITSQGISRPWLYTKRFIEIAFDNDCTVQDSKGQITHSYAKLFDLLDKKEDKSEFNVAWYYDLYISNLFHPLYTIGETETESFLVYETYLHNIARNKIIMSEKINDMTNLDFIDAVMQEVKAFTEGMDKRTIFKKKTDEEMMQENIEAAAAQQTEKAMEEQSHDAN
jgi:hypothetical protein